MGVEKEKLSDPDERSTTGFSLPLTLKQHIWFAVFIPTALCCAIYIADIATDIALVERHFSDQRCAYGVVTLVLIYLPAVVFFILTLRDEEKWPLEEDGTFRTILWVVKQVALLLVFPINAIHRFAGRLFWSLEALLSTDEEQEDALAEASKTSWAELYLLLQAFFQAAPQAVLQTYILASFKVPQERTGVIQILGITTSLASVAISAATYMRFESQRVAGRETPWATYKKAEKLGLETKESLMTTIESQITADTVDSSPTGPKEEETTAVAAEEEPKAPALPKGVPQSAILSLPPLPPQIRARLLKATGEEIPEDLKKDLESSVVAGEPLNIRSSLYAANVKAEGHDLTTLDLTMLPPAAPAPPPPPPPRSPSPLLDGPPPPPPIPLDIPMDDNEDLPGNDDESEGGRLAGTASTEPMDDMEALSQDQSPTTELRVEETLSSEPLLEHSTTATLEVKPITPINHTSIPLPTRKWKIEGLGEDEFVGKFIAFLWWFLFVTSRVLSLATLAFFSPWGFAAIVLLHYLGMVSYLFYCEKSKTPETTLLRLGLGFVYLLCFVEVGTKFKKPKKFTLGFIVVGAVENLVTAAAWFMFAVWTSWWFLYCFYLIVATLFLSLLSTAMYLHMLKPHTTDIYTN